MPDKTAAIVAIEAKKRVEPHLEALKHHRQSRSRLDRFALWITKYVGSMGFFLVIVLWTVGWLGWNMLGPKSARFDPYPGFVLWLFISNMIQLFLMPMILIGQNLESKESDLRAEADLALNKQAEKENQVILHKLDALQKDLKLLTANAVEQNA
jgi:uncharacterized membrane protein